MKSIGRILLIMTLLLLSGHSLEARGRLNVSGGVNVSHLCERLIYEDGYGWGVGAFAGCGYEISLTSHWSLMPQLELSYIDNAATLDVPENDRYLNRHVWRSSLNAVIPVTAGFRFNISRDVRLKVSAGPFLQEAILVRRYDSEGDMKVTAGVNFINRINVGMIGELSVETGRRLSYVANARYPMLKEVWSRQTLTLSLGLRYHF